MDPRDKTYSVVLFPFLKTSSPVRLGSLEFRSIDDIDGLPQDQSASVAEIANMLFASGNQRIERASFAIVDRVDLWSWSDPVCLDALSDIEAVVAYLYAYASPRHGFSNIFLTPEHASIVVLTPNRVAPVLMRSDYNVINVGEHVDLETDAAGFVDGYDGIFGLWHRFWVASGSRVYGTTPSPTLNISQDLASDVQQSSCARADYHLLFQLLMERGQNGDLRRQVFTAVRWFNRANSEHRAEAESFIVRRGGVDVPVDGCAGALGCYRVLNFRTDDGGGSARPATRDCCDPCPCCSLLRCMSMLPRKYAPSAMATRGATMSPSKAPPSRMSTFSEAAMLPLIAPTTINVLAKTSALILPVDPMVSV